MSTGRLTEPQARTLAIVEAGRERGVTLDSIVREERVEGRLRADICRTVYSLEARGLVRREVRREDALTEDGRAYVRRTTIVTATRED